MAELPQLLELLLPSIAAAAGSVIATRVSVARLQEDVRGLFRRVESIQKEMHSVSISQEREIGAINAKLASVATSVDSLRSPWRTNKTTE